MWSHNVRQNLIDHVVSVQQAERSIYYFSLNISLSLHIYMEMDN